MSETTRNRGLLILIWILAALAVVPMLPWAASKTNDLAYYSLCPFAPWSTLALLLVAGVIWAIRQYFETRAQ
jgi:tryptophan-rich sensory protein